MIFLKWLYLHPQRLNLIHFQQQQPQQLLWYVLPQNTIYSNSNISLILLLQVPYIHH